MEISNKGLELIKRNEGCRLTAYKDAVGVLTIGYGHTGNVRRGQTISQTAADALLRQDIAPITHAINGMHVNFRQNQFDALCSFVYNVGWSAFRNSTLYKYIIADKSDQSIADQIMRWHFAGGKSLNGLVKRRKEEAELWLK